MKSHRAAFSILALVVALLGCGGDAEMNHPPNVVALVVKPENPAPNSVATLHYDVLDVDGDAVDLRWETSGGDIGLDGFQSIWNVPDAEGTYQVTLIASDGQSTGQKTVDALVWQPREGNYYPLAVGNRWLYQDSVGNDISFEIVDTIQIENTDRTSYVIETTTTDPGVPEGVVNYSYVGRIEDGIEQHGVNVIFGSPDTLIFDPWLPLYKFPFIPGKEWSQKFRGFVQDGFFIGEGIARYRIIDESTVTTPAGTFEHVFQIEETFEWDLLGQDIDTTVSRKWLAPDVGIIMIDQEQTRGKQTQAIRAEIVSFELRPDTSFDYIPPADSDAAAAPFIGLPLP